MADLLAKQKGWALKEEKSGYLTKQGHVRKSWRKRWFTLKNGCLKYYKDQKDAKEAGSITISSSTKVQEVNMHGRSFVFEIVSPDKSLLLQADNFIEMKGWIDRITQEAQQPPDMAQGAVVESAVEDEDSDVEAAGVVDVSGADEQGYMVKQGHVRKNWKRRYFMLKGRKLYYFKTKPETLKDAQPLGVVEVDRHCELREMGDEGPRAHCIFVKGSAEAAKSFILQAEQESAFKTWVKALQQARTPDGDVARALAQKGIIRVKFLRDDTFVTLKVTPHTAVEEVEDMVKSKALKSDKQMAAFRCELMEFIRGKGQGLNGDDKVLDIIAKWRGVPDCTLACVLKPAESLRTKAGEEGSSEGVGEETGAEATLEVNTNMVVGVEAVDQLIGNVRNSTRDDPGAADLDKELLDTLADLETMAEEMEKQFQL